MPVSLTLYMCVYIQRCICVFIYSGVYVCLYTAVYMCVYIQRCICLFIYKRRVKLGPNVNGTKTLKTEF